MGYITLKQLKDFYKKTVPDIKDEDIILANSDIVALERAIISPESIEIIHYIDKSRLVARGWFIWSVSMSPFFSECNNKKMQVSEISEDGKEVWLEEVKE